MRETDPEKRPFRGTKAGVLLSVLLLMVLLHALRVLLEQQLAPLLPASRFGEQMLTMAAMILLTDLLILAAKVLKRPFSLFPERFTKTYVIAACVTGLLYIFAPGNFTGGLRPVLLLVYGSLVTPAYEELLFRGLIWNGCASAMEDEKRVFAWNVLLFTLWRLGYMLPQLADGDLSAVLWKLAAGLGYGLVLGLVRLKTKNCFACFLVHGVLNLFMV